MALLCKDTQLYILEYLILYRDLYPCSLVCKEWYNSLKDRLRPTSCLVHSALATNKAKSAACFASHVYSRKIFTNCLRNAVLCSGKTLVSSHAVRPNPLLVFEFMKTIIAPSEFQRYTEVYSNTDDKPTIYALPSSPLLVNRSLVKCCMEMYCGPAQEQGYVSLNECILVASLCDSKQIIKWMQARSKYMTRGCFDSFILFLLKHNTLETMIELKAHLSGKANKILDTDYIRKGTVSFNVDYSDASLVLFVRSLLQNTNHICSPEQYVEICHFYSSFYIGVCLSGSGEEEEEENCKDLCTFLFSTETKGAQTNRHFVSESIRVLLHNKGQLISQAHERMQRLVSREMDAQLYEHDSETTSYQDSTARTETSSKSNMEIRRLLFQMIRECASFDVGFDLFHFVQTHIPYMAPRNNMPYKQQQQQQHKQETRRQKGPVEDYKFDELPYTLESTYTSPKLMNYLVEPYGAERCRMCYSRIILLYSLSVQKNTPIPVWMRENAVFCIEYMKHKHMTPFSGLEVLRNMLEGLSKGQACQEDLAIMKQLLSSWSIDELVACAQQMGAATENEYEHGKRYISYNGFSAFTTGHEYDAPSSSDEDNDSVIDANSDNQEQQYTPTKKTTTTTTITNEMSSYIPSLLANISHIMSSVSYVKTDVVPDQLELWIESGLFKKCIELGFMNVTSVACVVKQTITRQILCREFSARIPKACSKLMCESGLIKQGDPIPLEINSNLCVTRHTMELVACLRVLGCRITNPAWAWILIAREEASVAPETIADAVCNFAQDYFEELKCTGVLFAAPFYHNSMWIVERLMELNLLQATRAELDLVKSIIDSRELEARQKVVANDLFEKCVIFEPPKQCHCIIMLRIIEYLGSLHCWEQQGSTLKSSVTEAQLQLVKQEIGEAPYSSIVEWLKQ